MSVIVYVNWKLAVALGTAVCGIILASKVKPEAAERVLTHAVDTCKEFMVARNGNHELYLSGHIIFGLCAFLYEVICMSADSELFVKSLRENIRNGLCEIVSYSNWLDEYEAWKSKDLNRFNSLLEIDNPFDLKEGLIRQEYDISNSEDVVALDVISMSVFLSERLRQESKKVFSDVRKERSRNKIIKNIERYFDLVNSIVANKNLASSIIPLNNHAEKQMVLFGNRSVDLYARFFSLRECLRKETTESMYLLYTYWRITKSRKNLKTLVNAISDYIHTYFYDYGNDPDMHLNYPLDGMTSINKLDCVFHWLEYIAFHTNGIFEKYKDLDWIRPVDILVDDIIETNQVSRFEMFSMKQLFPTDNNDTVRKKAICNRRRDLYFVFCCHNNAVPAAVSRLYSDNRVGKEEVVRPVQAVKVNTPAVNRLESCLVPNLMKSVWVNDIILVLCVRIGNVANQNARLPHFAAVFILKNALAPRQQNPLVHHNIVMIGIMRSDVKAEHNVAEGRVRGNMRDFHIPQREF